MRTLFYRKKQQWDRNLPCYRCSAVKNRNCSKIFRNDFLANEKLNITKLNYAFLYKYCLGTAKILFPEIVQEKESQLIALIWVEADCVSNFVVCTTGETR